MQTVIILAFYILFPAFVLYLGERLTWVKKIGSVVICYASGLLAGNLGLFPDNVSNLQDSLTLVTVPLALPLLLFSANVRQWLKLARSTVTGMILAFIAVITAVVSGFYLFHDKLDDAWKIAGMLTGVYTGGTPNLASIKTALNVAPDTYILTHTYDLIISASYLLLLVSGGKRLFGLVLPAFPLSVSPSAIRGEAQAEADDMENYSSIFAKAHLAQQGKALLLAGFVFLIGGGLSFIVPERISMVSAILTITTLGILFSLLPSVNKIPNTFQMGMYFILVFSLVVASMADISEILNISKELLFYVIIAIWGSLLLNVLLCKIFRIDADTMMIISTAFILSPPFVPMVAGAIRNKMLIISGLTAGILGYAIGNYLGITLAYILQ